MRNVFVLVIGWAVGVTPGTVSMAADPPATLPDPSPATQPATPRAEPQKAFREHSAAPREVLLALVRATEGRDFLAREGLAMAISKAHPNPDIVLATLRDLSKSEDSNVRARAMAGLREVERGLGMKDGD